MNLWAVLRNVLAKDNYNLKTPCMGWRKKNLYHRAWWGTNKKTWGTNKKTWYKESL